MLPVWGAEAMAVAHVRSSHRRSQSKVTSTAKLVWAVRLPQGQAEAAAADRGALHHVAGDGDGSALRGHAVARADDPDAAGPIVEFIRALAEQAKRVRYRATDPDFPIEVLPRVIVQVADVDARGTAGQQAEGD